MPVKINGSTSGSVTLAAPATGSDVTLTLPAAAGTVITTTDVAWSTWTPTYTNLSGGTLNVARYCQVGKLVTCYWKYTLGGAGVAGGVTVSLPVTASSNMLTGTNIGWASFEDNGVDNYQGLVQYNTTTTVNLNRLINDTNNIKTRSLSATAPFTFGSGDLLFAYWSYEAA